jgi:hypothetical protein
MSEATCGYRQPAYRYAHAGYTLNQQFVQRTVTPESLKASISILAQTQGTLRETHLKYHLLTVTVLGPAQMGRYAELRGYGGHRHHRD